MKKVFEHAHILTMDDQFTAIRDGWLLVNGKTIEAMGEGAYPGECDERIDARGGILLPGFVNTHCHVSMVPFRTMGDDCADRLRRFLFPLEDQAMTSELVYLGALYGIAEMQLAGVTTFFTMAYILLVSPSMMGQAGMDMGAVFVATALSAAVGGGIALDLIGAGCRAPNKVLGECYGHDNPSIFTFF